MAKRIVIAGGGTGGHLYPGIALAQSLMKNEPDIEITFVGTQKGLEAKVLPREGFKLKTILSGGLLGKKGMSRWVSWSKLPVGVAQSMCFLIRQRPDLVVGVGGYVSGPLVASAWVLRIPILIHEQNALPGITNRLLGKFADKIAISFKESARFFPPGKTTDTGNMVREEFSQALHPAPITADKPLQVLILGGSQGAQSINQAIIDALPHLESLKDRLSFVHQTGDADLLRVQQAYQSRGFQAEALAFIFDVQERYQSADFVICRAGATTLAEVTACGKVSMLIPFPYAAHNHQEKNARVLEAAEAAEVVLDQDLNGQRMAQAITEALEQPDELNRKAENSYALGKRDATEHVRQLCMELIQGAQHIAETPPKGKNTLSCF